MRERTKALVSEIIIKNEVYRDARIFWDFYVYQSSLSLSCIYHTRTHRRNNRTQAAAAVVLFSALPSVATAAADAGDATPMHACKMKYFGGCILCMCVYVMWKNAGKIVGNIGCFSSLVLNFWRSYIIRGLMILELILMWKRISRFDSFLNMLVYWQSLYLDCAK